MKIKEFQIHRYGPLGDSGVIRLENFNLFYGNNEDGKTLTLEAIISFLLGKSRRVFSGIERVPQLPEGFLLLEYADGETVHLTSANNHKSTATITNILDVAAEEFRNLFIIRNSDLSISREAAFYRDITEKLTGLRTRHLQQIRKKLRELGHFTNGMDTLNTRENHYLKSRLQQAEGLIDECQALYHEAASRGYDILEENLVEMQQRLRELDETFNTLGKARLRERYETARKQLDLIYSFRQKGQDLQQFTLEELIQWQQAEAFIEEKDTELKLTIQQCKACEDEVADEQKKLRDLHNQMEIRLQRKRDIDERLKPALRQYGEIKKRSARSDVSRPFFLIAIGISMIFALASLFGLMWRPAQTFILWIAILSGTATFGLSLLYFFRFINPQGNTQELAQQVMHLAGELGFPGDEISNIQERVQQFEEEFQRRRQQIAETEGRVSFLESQFHSLRDEQIENLETRLEAARETIRQIRVSRQVEILADYQNKYREQRRLEQQINDAAAVLKGIFGPAIKNADRLDEQIQSWENEVNDLKKHQFAAAETEFDEEKQLKLTESRAETQAEVELLQRELTDFHTRLGDIQRRVYETILPAEEIFPGRTLNDLKQFSKMLKTFVDDIHTQQKNARAAIEIFDEIEGEDRQKISELFGNSSRVSTLYKQISGELYPLVFYDFENNCVRIRRRDGKELPPEWLSSGAYDQLYFTIRLALGEKLLQGEKGFFIFDDPFLKSDSGRLKQQLETLVDISREGWQVLYFTAKDEVVSALHRHIERGLVTLQEAPRVDFKE